MANDVFANGREVSCKKADGKSICAFPDVCFTPPENPATPPGVPVPYPNTGMAKDMTSGSKAVKISGKEVMLKNKSYFKKSIGDEAGCAAKKGVVTSVNRGKVYFISWSMDVKFEGENIVRHLDMTTHNHSSPTTNTPPALYADSQVVATTSECQQDRTRAKTACEGQTAPDCDETCKEAQKCILAPKKGCEGDKNVCCKEDTTGHHLIEVHCFSPTGERGGSLEDLEAYNQREAPCVCAATTTGDGTHGRLHAVQGKLEGAFDKRTTTNCEWLDAGDLIPGGGGKRDKAYSKWNYQEARDCGARAHNIVFPDCNEECIKKQLDAYHKDECGFDEQTPLRTDPGAKSRNDKKMRYLMEDQIERVNKAVETIKKFIESATPV